MKTILHIGQHKTGTTSLQHYLKQNRNTLIEQGIYIPDILAGTDSPSHYMLNVYSLAENRSSPMKDKILNSYGKDRLKAIEKDIKADIKGHYAKAHEKKCSEIIWSNEGLYLLNSVDEYKKLTNLFENYSDEIICICTFREKTEFILSYTKQLIKQGIEPSNNEDSYRFIDSSSWLLNYKRKRNILNEVFKTLICIPYESDDMITTFMKYLGHDINIPPNTRLNITN